jgi:solute carrier family 13 (sodium-dependent dicarboxylate transporter), member 2/3/5
MRITKAQARKGGLILGPVLFLVVLFFPASSPEGLTFEAKIVLAAALWMASWWITEAIPIYVTALLPLIIFPSLGVTKFEETSASYANNVVFLFLGGFILAKAVEKSNMHSRFALNMLKVVGTNPKYIIAAFMVSIGLLGSWISNTAVTMLMLPVASAVISLFRNPGDRKKFGLCLMLSVAYSASISGVMTLIASPPNAIFASVSKEIADIDVSFSQWMAVGFPIGLLSILIAWWYMVNFGASIRDIKPIAEEKGLIDRKLSELGRMTRDEKLVLGIFAATATAWITRGLLWGEFVPAVGDATIAVAATLPLFLLPSSRKTEKIKRQDRAKDHGNSSIHNNGNTSRVENGSANTDDNGDENNKSDRLLNWKSVVQIPWGVLLLIGGGIALAHAFTATGLDKLIAEQLIFLEGMEHIIIILIVIGVTALVGEFMSNTAVAALMIPISASLATSLGMNPILLMVPVTIVTSFSFIMPVSTPPNTIVFASGYVTIPNMIKAGLPLKIIGVIMVTILTTLLVPLVWK